MKKRKPGLFLTCTLCLAGSAHAGLMDQFIDDDGWVDGSDWVLDNAVGFMPVPIVITEPAVGEGLGAALAFFHPPKNYSKDEYEAALKERAKAKPGENKAGEKEKFVMPDVTVVAAAATNNGTWLVGGGHIAHWKDDTIRFEGIAGYASVNVNYYIPGPGGQDIPFEFNGEGFLSSLPLAFRLGGSNFFLGGNWNYSQVQTKFDKNNPILEPLNFKSTQSALGVFLQYDTRNTTFTPTKGTYAEISYSKESDKVGSDWDFGLGELWVHQYFTLSPKWALGLRGDFIQIDGDYPFYAAPYIQLRGIPALRYQGESVAVLEGDIAWRFHPRMAVNGFAGVGKADDSFSDLSDSPSRVTRGLGFRYNAARKLGMWAGIDVAKGPEDTYWYITMGSPWRD